LFPEDLHLDAVLNAPHAVRRRGLLVNWSEGSFDLIAAGARASLANASRDARAKLQLVIDEYLLSVRPQPSATQSKTLKSRLFDSVSLKPGAFGLSIDLKNLFTRKRQD
jgi:hypothetical protein